MSAILALLVAAAASPQDAAPPNSFALRASKALVLPLEGPQVINDATVVVLDGKIASIGPSSEVLLPAELEVIDVGDRWISPGMIDLHCHVAGESFFVNDLNDMVYLTNPGIRAWTSVEVDNSDFKNATQAGVTAVLYIPGSGTNIGGQGVLLKTGFDEYERAEIRNPGSLKLAQAGNPESFTIGVGRSFMNWNTRNTFQRGLAYAAQRKEGTRDADPMWQVFEDLADKKTQVSTHTQIYQVVAMTISMVRQELGLDVYIDHGSFDGWRAAPEAEKHGVPAILGPRQIAPHIFVEYRPGMFIGNDTDGAIYGMAERYQSGGHSRIGFNTDSPVIPQEELPLQASMATRYGFDNSNVDHVRGLTIIPATAAGIADRVGSLEVGKDADFIVCDGDPTDPRTTISMTFLEGERVYDLADPESGRRRW